MDSMNGPKCPEKDPDLATFKHWFDQSQHEPSNLESKQLDDPFEQAINQIDDIKTAKKFLTFVADNNLLLFASVKIKPSIEDLNFSNPLHRLVIAYSEVNNKIAEDKQWNNRHNLWYSAWDSLVNELKSESSDETS